MTGDPLRTLRLRTFEPRCTRFSWRHAGLLLTTPLTLYATGLATSAIWREMTSPGVPGVLAVVAIFVAWMWTFSRRGPIAQARQGFVVRRRRRHARDPWTADHRWDPRGAKRVPPSGGRPSGCVWILVAWGIVVTLGWMPAAMAAALALAFLAWVCAPWLGFDGGRAFVAFVRFPYSPGERVELHFGLGGGGPTFVRARYVLRRIREIDGPWVTGGPRRTATTSIDCRLPQGVLPGPESDVRLLFDVPEDAGGTALSATLPSYWELVVVGETTKGWFEETFLVPIYERPAAAAAT